MGQSHQAAPNVCNKYPAVHEPMPRNQRFLEPFMEKLANCRISSALRRTAGNCGVFLTLCAERPLVVEIPSCPVPQDAICGISLALGAQNLLIAEFPSPRHGQLWDFCRNPCGATNCEVSLAPCPDNCQLTLCKN